MMEENRQSVVEEETQTFVNTDLEELFSRLKGVEVGLRATAEGSMLGFGPKQAQLLNILLTFLDAIKQPAPVNQTSEARPEGLESGEEPNPFSIEEVKADLLALQQLLKDAALPGAEKTVLDRYCNELLIMLSDLIGSFELYTNATVFDKAMWPLTGPHLQDKLLAYIAKHKSTMSLYGSLNEFKKAMQHSTESGEVMGEAALVLRQKVAQGAWKEVVNSAIEEAQMLRLGISQPRIIVDSPLVESEETARALRMPVWSAPEWETQRQLFTQIEQAIQPHFPEEVTTDLRTLWALAEGADTSLLEKQSAATILLGAEHVLQSLRKRRFMQILAEFMDTKGAEDQEISA